MMFRSSAVFWHTVYSCLLFLQGTNKRSQLDLEKEVESLGMQLYADAGREHFGIFANCLPQDVPKGLKLLSIVEGAVDLNTCFIVLSAVIVVFCNIQMEFLIQFMNCHVKEIVSRHNQSLLLLSVWFIFKANILLKCCKPLLFVKLFGVQSLSVL